MDYPVVYTTLDGEDGTPWWEIAVTVSDSGGFQQMSFVNGIATVGCVGVCACGAR